MQTLKEDMLQEIEDEESLTDKDWDSFIRAFAQVTEEVKRRAVIGAENRTQSEQEPVTQTLNG